MARGAGKTTGGDPQPITGSLVNICNLRTILVFYFLTPLHHSHHVCLCLPALHALFPSATFETRSYVPTFLTWFCYPIVCLTPFFLCFKLLFLQFIRYDIYNVDMANHMFPNIVCVRVAYYVHSPLPLPPPSPPQSRSSHITTLHPPLHLASKPHRSTSLRRRRLLCYPPVRIPVGRPLAVLLPPHSHKRLVLAL